MKKEQMSICLMVALFLIAATLIGCTGAGPAVDILGGGAPFPTTPKFVVAIDTDTSGNNVNVFPIDATAGTLGSAVSGSPFDLGFSNALTIAVHPNGHWLYVADGSDGSIHAIDVNESTGVPTSIGTVPNESGSFYQPNTYDAPHVIAVTPNGKYLYAGNDDSKISEYSINSSTGALTHITDLDLGARSTGAVTATNSFVWVTDTDPATCPNGPGDSTPEYVHAMSIGSNGTLTFVNKATLTNVYCWLWSIAVSPDGKFVQVGDEGGDAQIYSFTVGADGSLTQVGPQVVETSSSDCRDIAFSPDGKFLYTTDDDDEVHAIAQNTDGSISELGASPYTDGQSEGQINVDRSGKFVYAGGYEITGYTRTATSGALTIITSTSTGGYPYAVNFVY